MTIPRSILIFALAYGATLLVTLIHGALTTDSLRIAMPEAAALFGDVFAPFMLLIRFAFGAWLGWLIVYRANRLAKWFIVLLLVVKLFRVGDAWEGLQAGNVNSILWTTGTALAILAVTSLFLPASRFWFASKGRSVKGDAAVFE